MIFHITTSKDWQQAQQAGEYRAASLETEGFIHCSNADQVAWVANNFYRAVPDLVLLQIDPSKLTAELRYDEIETGDRFPHIYGALNLDAVVHVLEFAPQADGTFSEFKG
ncbi:MAG: DUF952 domain-containing protein [Leptolyngbyaceae cyanobacterium bins.302]|nr:DUF952 domain-containing protein [Leptolyngbyaceae cyanobacterium bins.302]